ncbi:TRL domain-containing protein [Leptospira idonii]|uniref:TRL-like family protein n=1 Tax=Leptospira idonii TaxID=1193500 RepID=A0A4R9M4W9_9LEPT|nr:TRL domain-containing protein [Leptospira idonii]TGN20289.1 TRL-like family protein [Leptospira idonii]
MRKKFLSLLLTTVGCISIQQGNPSLTVFKNNGSQGIFGKSVSWKDEYKMGEACVSSYAGLISIGDASVESAARASKIKDIYSINHVYKTQYFFLQEFCTLVYGL